MALPGFQDLMLPMLRLASDGNEHSYAEAMDVLAKEMNISESEQAELLPSGGKTKLYNRVAWASTTLVKSLLFERTARGRFKIAARGLEVLEEEPMRVDNAYLERFSEFLEFKSKKPLKDDGGSSIRFDEVQSGNLHVTPEESMDSAYIELRETLADELIEKVQAGTPKFFEQLVVDLLVAMGYGGSHGDRARVVGRSGDGGIDGVIPEDRLGLDMVYIQAKKWQGSVGPDEIRKFVGSLGEQRANKGVFITSGTFTLGARHAAERAHLRVVLIDGNELAQLMIDHGIGVTAQRTYVLKKLDGDYFEGI